MKDHQSLDWNRIRHLLKVGIFAALMVLAGDMLLGWGMHPKEFAAKALAFFGEEQ